MGSRGTEANEAVEAPTLQGGSPRHSLDPATAAALPQPGTLIAGKYRIEQLIAHGGMGAVFAATHVVSDKRVALKWMLPALGAVQGATERFIGEARATARIDHPNIVDIYDVGSEKGSVYLVMEFLHGETLLQRMGRPFATPGHALALLMPALRGVAAAHARGVVHRDLKPENIFLCQSPDGEPREPKVLDFGISKIAGGDRLRDLALTQSGMVMGTPYYMSPEQVRGAKEVDERGDVYAFGVILYEMLTGHRPFDAETYNHLILKIASEDPVPIPTLNPDVEAALVAIIERAMARAPEARFQSVEALALALEPHAGGSTFRLASAIPGELSRPSSGRVPRPSTPRRLTPTPAEPMLSSVRGRMLIAGLAIGLVLAGMSLWSLWRPDNAKLSAKPLAETAARNDSPRAEAQPLPAEPRPASPAATTATPTTAQAPTLPVGLETPPAPEAQRRPQHPPAKRAARTKSTPDGLPTDWDERLPTTPATDHSRSGPAPSAAGRINAGDLR